MLPAIVLKKMVMGNFDRGIVDQEIADSIDFMVQSVSLWLHFAGHLTFVYIGIGFGMIECVLLPYVKAQWDGEQDKIVPCLMRKFLSVSSSETFLSHSLSTSL